MGRKGYTLVEVFMVLVILSILAAVGLFRYIDFRKQAQSAKIAADLQAVRLAALTAWSDTQSWPGETGPGIVPPEIAPHLPGNVAFANPDFTIDWDNLSGGGGGGGGGFLVGISLTTPDSALMVHLQRTLGTTFPYILVGGRLTYILVDASGVF